MRLAFLFLLLLGLLAPVARSISEDCAALVPQLSESCPAFDYDQSPPSRPERATTDTSVSDTISGVVDAVFDESCCDLITELNASRCFCEQDVVEGLASEVSDDLFAVAVFSAARAIPEGCGSPVWTALDGGTCRLLGPEPENGSDCRSLEDELRSPRLLSGSFALVEEALDSTGVLNEIESLRQFVFFAPTDAGLRSFAQEQNLSIGELLSKRKLLRRALRRHVVSGRNIRDLSKDSAEVETLQGSTLNVRRKDDLSVQGVPVEGEDRNMRTRTETTGTDCRNIYNLLLSSEEDFGQMLDEVDRVGEIKDMLRGSEALTVFAPSPRRRMRIDVNRAALERLIVEGDVPSEDLSNGETLESISGESLKLSVENGVVSIEGVEVVDADRVACNGRIHVLKDWIQQVEETADIEVEAAVQSLPPIEEVPKVDEDIMEAGTDSPDDSPCGCALDGVSNGVETDFLGCKQHSLDSGINGLFCYIRDSKTCEEESETVASSSFPDAFWRFCEREEADLPSTANVLRDTSFLQHVLEFFTFSQLGSLLSSDTPRTFFLPDAAAFEGQNLAKLLDEGQQGAQELRTLFKRHIIDGDMTENDLLTTGNITTLDGTVLSVLRGSNGTTILDNSVKITQSNIYTQTGIIHLVDSFFRPHLINSQDDSEPCACSEEEDADSVPSGRTGCREHVAGERPFCYVSNPSGCAIGTDSTTAFAAKWRRCKDPCRCTETGLSGTANPGRRSCGRHVPGDDPFCYVADPDRCQDATPSIQFSGAKWKWCRVQDAPSAPCML